MAKKQLTNKQKHFCCEYVIDWNATRAYKLAYPKTKTDNVAAAAASRLLRNVNIEAYCEEIQKDLSKLTGVTAARNILELKKIAYSNLSDFKDGWMTEVEFDSLTLDQKAALSEIQYTTKSWDGGEETIVKFKVHDKQKALEILNKMLGLNAASKLTIDGDLGITTMTQTERQAKIDELRGKLGEQ